MAKRLIGPKPKDAVKVFEVFHITFLQAFATARREGWPMFSWRGGLYHTRRADDATSNRPKRFIDLQDFSSDRGLSVVTRESARGNILGQGGEAVSRLAHNQKVVGSSPTLATKFRSPGSR